MSGPIRCPPSCCRTVVYYTPVAAQNRTELRVALSIGKATKFVRTRGFIKLTRFRITENLVNPLFWTWTWLKTLLISLSESAAQESRGASAAVATWNVEPLALRNVVSATQLPKRDAKLQREWHYLGGGQRATTKVQHRFVPFFLLYFLLFCSPWAKTLCFEGESPGGKMMKKCQKVRKMWTIMKRFCPLVFLWLISASATWKCGVTATWRNCKRCYMAQLQSCYVLRAKWSVLEAAKNSPDFGSWKDNDAMEIILEPPPQDGEFVAWWFASLDPHR